MLISSLTLATMYSIASTRVSPAPPLQQKVQKNFRLTQVAIGMLQDLARAWGVNESQVIERLAREGHDHYGLTHKDRN